MQPGLYVHLSRASLFKKSHDIPRDLPKGTAPIQGAKASGTAKALRMHSLDGGTGQALRR